MFSVCENKKKNISTERLIGDLHCLKLSCPQQLLNESVCRITLILPDIALCLVQKASLKTNEDMSKKQQYTGHSCYFCQGTLRLTTLSSLAACKYIFILVCLIWLCMLARWESRQVLQKKTASFHRHLHLPSLAGLLLW